MGSFYVNFAKSGNPNFYWNQSETGQQQDQWQWPAYSRSTDTTAVLNLPLSIVTGLKSKAIPLVPPLPHLTSMLCLF